MASHENWFSRRKGKHTGAVYKLDTFKTPEESIIEIIQGLYLKKSIQNETSPTNNFFSETKTIPAHRNIQRSSSDSFRVSYLNSLVTLLCKSERSDLGFTTDELMTCIRVSLVDESMVIRAAALRVLRYLIKTESDVATFNSLRLPYLVVRSIDLLLRNEEERAQALRVIRRVIAVVGSVNQFHKKHRAAYIDQGLLRCLASVARASSAGDGTGDRMSRPAIAALAEISVLNSDLFILCGGVSAVTRQLAECATPRMAEALCGVLLHTLNEPMSRHVARVDLTCLTSPYCDFHIRPTSSESSRDEREMRFTCSRLALLCVLRSWPGILHFCNPNSTGGLRALIAALHLPRLEVRKAILDLLYELVGLPQPEWTDEISVALDAVDPSDFQDSWRLNDGFVAAEGIAILPHLSATGPDITEIHLALLLQCFLEAGLLDGLAEVIVTSDTFISVRATVLLGQLLHLIHLLLPPQVCNITPALPILMSQATAGKPQALAAVAALRRLHSMLDARPASNSLFLDHIIQYCSGAFIEKDNIKPQSLSESIHKDNSTEFLNDSDDENEPRQRHSVGSRADVQNRNISALVKSKSVSSRTSAAVSKVTKSTKLFSLFERDSDYLIRSTLVMQNKDGNKWNWEVIRAILKENDNTPFLNLDDNTHKVWAARIINYLKPSSNKYSHTDLSSTSHVHIATRAGCQLIRHLLRHNDFDSQKLLEDLFMDVSSQVEAIETGRKAHECLFSPQHMNNTMCQMYFLFIGQLCHSQNGLKLFKQTKLYDNLLELSTKTHHSCYVKLVISSLDYTIDSYPRDILAKTLTCNIQASRIYVTQFLNVLLRASQKSKDMIRRKSKRKVLETQEHVRTNKCEENSVDMNTWLLQMLIGQLKDECRTIVKCALSILEEAYSVPAYLDKLVRMRDTLGQNCRLDKTADPNSLDISAVGDRGYLIWLSLEVHAATSGPLTQEQLRFLKKHIDFWMKNYNYRYVRLVESCIHDALTMCESGRGARTRRSARPPPHLYSAVVHARHLPQVRPHARALLAPLLHTHYTILQSKNYTSEQEIMDLKASLWAIGHAAVSLHGLQLLMNLSNGSLEDSVPVHIVKLANYSPVYSVRATAFYVLGLIGSTYDGANLLAELGWYSVRHTRHDQFPIIQDEVYPTTLNSVGNVQNPVVSPNRRFAVFDNELSEQSDHTEPSVAESLPLDYSKVKFDGQEKDQDTLDGTVNTLAERKEREKRKSNTLPTQASASHERPLLTESKTVDILRDFNTETPGSHRVSGLESRILIGRMNSFDGHEGRVRNTSESSTSGVSSCDSFLGKYAIPDRILTLSPIPSSSSLYGMKSNTSSQRPRISEPQRRTSTSSFSASEAASSPPTQMDMTGYATWKDLNKHRRPHLSESAASGSSEIEDISWMLTDTNRRSKPFSSLRDRSKATREKINKLSLLEYDWRPLPASERSRHVIPARESRAPRPAPPPARLRHYIGVCLPQNLDALLLRTNEESKLDNDIKCEVQRRVRIPSFLADSSNASTDNKSRTTPDSQKTGTHRAGSGATTAAASVRVASSTSGAANTDTGSSEKTERADNTDTIVTTCAPLANTCAVTLTDVSVKAEVSVKTSGMNAAAAESEAIRLLEEGKWHHITTECLACVRTRPPSAHELREAFFAGMEKIPERCHSEPRSPPKSPAPERSPQAAFLKHARFMCNPIHFRQTRSAIITLKQVHPEIFRSPCLYSDMCALLGRNTYMLCARRFLQDQFLDTNFECFLSAPAAILARHAPLSPVNKK